MNPTVDDRVTTGSAAHLLAVPLSVDDDPEVLAAICRVSSAAGRGVTRVTFVHGYLATV